MVLSVRSLVRRSVPWNYLLHLITDLRPLVAVNPYFPGLMRKINSARPAETLPPAAKCLAGIVRHMRNV